MSEGKRRPPQETDQAEATRMFDLLGIFFQTHDVEGAIMCAAMMSHVAENFQSSGHSYKEYCGEMKNMMKFYKRYWDEQP